MEEKVSIFENNRIPVDSGIQLENATCGRVFENIRLRVDVFSKIPGYVWTCFRKYPATCGRVSENTRLRVDVFSKIPGYVWTRPKTVSQS